MATSILLGDTGISISTVGLGCWQFAQGKGLIGSYWAALSPQTITQIIESSINMGINWFDTAEAYGWGSSEKVLAEGLKTLAVNDNNIYIATKWWPTPRPASTISGSARRSLKNLAGYPITLYQVHNPISLSSLKNQMKEMSKLVWNGIARHIGVSNFSAEQMRMADTLLQEEGLRLVSNQVRYSLLDRSIEMNGILETAQELGITIIAYSPLAQGLLTGRYHSDPGLIWARGGYRKFQPAFHQQSIIRTNPLIEILMRIGAQHQVLPAQIALAWLIQRNPGRVAVIPGASSAAQAEKNAATMNVKLGSQEIEELERSSNSLK